MLSYLYTMRYPMPGKALATTAEDFENQLLLDAKLYAVADKYDVAAFRVILRAFFAKDLESVGHYIDKTGMSSLEDLISIVYETTPDTDRGLRAPLQRFIERYKGKILGRHSIRRYAREHHSFAVDILDVRHMAGTEKKLLSYWCVECEKYELPGATHCKLEDYNEEDGIYGDEYHITQDYLAGMRDALTRIAGRNL